MTPFIYPSRMMGRASMLKTARVPRASVSGACGSGCVWYLADSRFTRDEQKGTRIDVWTPIKLDSVAVQTQSVTEQGPGSAATSAPSAG